MKKFLVVLSAIIVAITISMTFYYFAKDEEIIKINTSTIYLNVGDSISLDDLGFSHTEKKKETKINFNAGGDDVQSIIYFDKNTNKYITTNQGGSTTIVIKTNNKKFKRFEINVVVGNGSEETPFQISTEEDLFNIGTQEFDITPGDDVNDALTANYMLMNNITITQPHSSIGINENGTCNIFEGHLDGKYFSIEGLNITEGTYGGLFANLGQNAFVENLYIKNATVVGKFDYAGIVAGVNSGYIDRISITNSVVKNTNTSATSYTGGVAGKIMTLNPSNFDTTPATVYRVSISSENNSINYIQGYGYLGGIAGLIECANIEGIKIDTAIKSSNTNNYVGGFAGVLVLENSFGFVRESLSLATISAVSTNPYAGALFGLIDADGSSINVNSVLLGLYYINSNNFNVYGKTTLASISQGFATVSSKTDPQLKNVSTYLFYINTQDEKIAWNDAVWSLVEGQYPELKFTTLAISNGNIETENPVNPDQDNSSTTPNTPGDTDIPGDTNAPGNTNTPDSPIIKPDDPIVNPDLPSDVKENVVTISTASELINTTFLSNYSYFICNDINLNGATINPRALNNALFSSVDDNVYTISNFKITPTTNYLGFFSSINNSKVTKLAFKDVTLNIVESVDYVGVLAGRINNATITEVNVINSKIISNLTSTTAVENIPEFTGSLVGSSTTASNIIKDVTIKDVTIKGNLKNVGGIIGLINNNTKIVNSTISGNIAGREYVGGITAKNQGVISGCAIDCKISSVDQNEACGYFGGIAGANFSTIMSCKGSMLEMQASNKTTNKRYYVGGIAGYSTNIGDISSCEVLGDGIATDGNIGTMLLGGIAGQNDGRISYSYNKMDSIGSTFKSVYAGGITAKNVGNGKTTLYGNISKSYSSSDIYGEYVGGLVYANKDNGTIRESAVLSNAKLKGVYVAGLAVYLDSGLIKNCMVIAETCGLSTTENEAISAGLVMTINYYSSAVYGQVDHCVSSVTISSNSNGEHYLVTASNINSKKVLTGMITNCVIDKTNSANATLPSGKFSARTEEWRSSYVIVSYEEQMSQLATYDNFEISQDPDQVWYLKNGSYMPILTCLINK